MFVRTSLTLRPRLNKYVFIENDLAFNANATIVLQSSTHPVGIVSISFSVIYTKTIKTIENGKNQRKSIVCVSR